MGRILVIIVLVVLAVVAVRVLIHEKNPDCVGNVVARTELDNGKIQLRVHKGSGNDFCEVTEQPAAVLGCDVANRYPTCKG